MGDRPVCSTLARLATSLDRDLVVSSFDYTARVGDGIEHPERAVLMARSAWGSQTGSTRLGIGLGQSVTPDPHSLLRRPFCGIYAADQDVLDRLREFCGPSTEPWYPWAQWEYLSLDPPDEQPDLLRHYAAAIAEHARLTWAAQTARGSGRQQPAMRQNRTFDSRQNSASSGSAR